MKRYKIYLDSSQWTCFSNFSLISKLYKYMHENNHLITDDIFEADYIIINSCGHTQTSEDTTVDHFQEFYKKKKKDARIIICGCLTDINPERLEGLDVICINFKNIAKIDDIFFQKKRFNEIEDSCDIDLRNKIIYNKNFTSYKSHIIFFYPFARLFSKKINNNLNYLIEKLNASNTVLIKIGQGCTGNCSYCAIKKAKGSPISRDISEIIRDIKKSYSHNKSIYLIGDDCGSFGVDTGTSLIKLLYEINKIFPGIKIDIYFLEPIWLKKEPEKYIKLFEELNIGFVQIPLQSGSNRIVRSMNRRYDVNEILKIIDKIKKVSPSTTITTYYIIGFPGESLLDLIKTIVTSRHFDASLLLPFSERKGTTCENFKNKKSQIQILFNYILAVILIKTISLKNITKIKK